MAQGTFQGQFQSQKQQQVQRLSQRQIQAVNMIALNSRDLRNEIFRAVQENPALEIVSDPLRQAGSKAPRTGNSTFNTYNHTYSGSDAQRASNDFQAILEAQEDNRETLQQHLMEQLNMTKVSPDEYDLCQKLIYNLDKNGCYGSLLAPETLLNKTRPLQTPRLLAKCLDRIQRMDPIGTCCKTPEESLFIQAKIYGDANPLTLFILDGHLEFLNPPEPEKITRKLKTFREEWHKKTFATKLPIDDIELTSELAAETLQYILHLNPRPAAEYISDTSQTQFAAPDIVLNVTRESGRLPADDLSQGKIAANGDFHFQVKYANGSLPEIRIAQNMDFDKELLDKAQAFMDNLKFRESTIVLQGCAIVRAQVDFFDKGPGNLVPLTRHQIAQQLNIHDSTVSRFSARNNSRYIQTEWGLLPASYFFTSGIKTTSSKKISSDTIKIEISKVLEKSSSPLSDNQLTKLLNDHGIKIARRTVTKYRQQIGIENSYKR